MQRQWHVLIGQSSLLAFTACADRLSRYGRQLIPFSPCDLRPIGCSLATLTWTVVSNGSAADLQKFSLNSLEIIQVYSGGFCGEPKGAFHVDLQLTILMRAQMASRAGHSLTKSEKENVYAYMHSKINPVLLHFLLVAIF
jgi:hypothetical protein